VTPNRSTTQSSGWPAEKTAPGLGVIIIKTNKTFSTAFEIVIVRHHQCHNHSRTKQYHRLNGSSSPVLTATCPSHGSLCDFFVFFPQPTDYYGKRLKPRGFTQGRAFFCYKSPFLQTFDPMNPIPPKFTNFSRDLKQFRSHYAFNIWRLTIKQPSFFIAAHSTVIVNRQCVCGKVKYVHKFGIGGTGHVISRMRINGQRQALWRPISRNLSDRGLVTMEDE